VSDDPGPRLRPAVRAVIIDPADRILLVRFVFPHDTVWACPGGGIEPNESDETALRRELAEEAGLRHFDIGPCIWTRRHVIPMLGGRWDGQSERFYLVRTSSFEPRPDLSAEELRGEYVTAIRWWQGSELAASTESFAPRRLPELVAALGRNEVPGEPFDAGV
jgi:8-oxo-dGTP diphosphatase